MKKILILSTMALLSGCSCFQSENEEAAYSRTESATTYRGIDDQGCNYLNDEDCTRSKAQNYNQAQDYRRPADMYVYNSPRPRNVVMYKDAEPQPVYNITVQESQPTPVPVMMPTPTPIPAPIPVAVPTASTQTVASCGDIKSTVSNSTLPDGSPCPAQIKETREPVEVIYKKTTYKTVYEPKTTSSVSYEKEAYKQGSIQVNTTTPSIVEQISVTTNVEDVMPADEIK